MLKCLLSGLQACLGVLFPVEQPHQHQSNEMMVVSSAPQTQSQHHRQYLTSGEIPASLIGNGQLQGTATFIMDGDTFKFFHQPDASFQVPTRIHDLKSTTMSVRIAGIDAPEVSHGDGQPGMAFGQEAKDALSKMIYKKPVVLRLLDRDQYGRLVAAVSYDGGQDVATKMLAEGFAHLYTGRDASYGGRESEMRAAYDSAKRQRRGLWSQANVETPADYKRKHKQ
jgi:endonuclease YncB( thermonuclease family)